LASHRLCVTVTVTVFKLVRGIREKYPVFLVYLFEILTNLD